MKPTAYILACNHSMNLSGKPLKLGIESAGYYSSMRIALLVQAL